MSFGQCRKCNSYISLEEYNLGKYTNIGKGGLCFPCITLELKELEQLQAELAKPITEHPDVQRLVGQVVELQILVNDLLADKERLIGQLETLKKFVQNVADAYATGGDPEEECELCRGELQYSAKQVLKGK